MKVKLIRLDCKRCLYSWFPKHEDVRICPKCKSAFFDTPREVKEFEEKIKK